MCSFNPRVASETDSYDKNSVDIKIREPEY